ncbi:MAG: glycosyltransferase family 9 protein [Gammaproteobacteria bacterium]
MVNSITQEISSNTVNTVSTKPTHTWGPKILLLSTNHVGNTLFCTPGIHLLKQHLPQVQLDVVAMSPRAAAALSDNPDINKVYRMSCKWRVRRLAKRYNQIIGLHYDKFRHYFEHVTDKHFSIGEPVDNQHRAEEIIQYVQKLLNIAPQQIERNYVLRHRPEHLTKIKQLLAVGSTEQTFFVGIALGCGQIAAHGWQFWSKRRYHAKRLWSFEQYIKLAQSLQQHYPGLRFVLTGSRNEKALGAAFARKVPHTINLIGRTSLQEVAALMTQLRLFITHDTGTLHIACGTPVPVVALFGPTQLERTGPYPSRPQHTIIRKAHMDEIELPEVLDACTKILEMRR